MIISLSGVDCSGKSTQISRLSKMFGEDRTEIIWGRYGYTPGVEVLKKTYNSLRGNRAEKVKWASINSRTRFSFIGFLWRWVSIVDFLFHYGFMVRYRSKFKKIIILDRFKVDFFVDYECFHHKEVGLILRALSSLLLCKPKISFFLNVDIDTSLDRMVTKNDPYPETKEMLEKRRKLYVKYWHTGVTIDAGRGEDDVFEDIRSHIKAAA